MTPYVQKIAAALMVVTAFPAWAAHNNHRYSEPAYDNTQYGYAKVVDVQAVIEIVQIPEERQVCREQPVMSKIRLTMTKKRTQNGFYPRAPSLDAAHQFTLPSLRLLFSDRPLEPVNAN